jgi:hypothetical protein
MPKIAIDPITRIEGHLRIEALKTILLSQIVAACRLTCRLRLTESPPVAMRHRCEQILAGDGRRQDDSRSASERAERGGTRHEVRSAPRLSQASR